ncbi:MAG: polysaccharide pyruvyl transferase family protein [bacterium]|nr:polysaccharide pyruvyl transferase family protein [bacterium]
MKRKKVLLSAYVNQNLGDDLFVKIVCERYPNVIFILTGEMEHKRAYRSIPNLKFVSDNTLLIKVICKFTNIIKKIRKKPMIYRNKLLLNILSAHYKINILIGGSIFNETSTRLSELEMEQKWYKRHPYIIGCNFGPYSTKRFYEYCVQSFREATQVSFRDRYSYELFKELKNVSLATDVGFSLVHRTKDLGYYVFSVLDLSIVDYGRSKKFHKDYLEKILEIVNVLLASNKTVYIVSFCNPQGDMNSVNHIVKTVNSSSRVKPFSYEEEGMDKTLELLANAEGIVATRFHALVLGILFQKKVLPIMYSNKMKHLLDDLQIKDKTYSIPEFTNENTDKLMKNFLDMSKIDVDKLKQLSCSQFNKLDQVLLE